MSGPAEQVKSIFLRAIEGYSPDEWPAFLDEACSGDAALRAGVEKLLRAQAEMGSFHEPEQPLGDTVNSPLVDRPGTTIGAYKLLEQVGEGGFGVVFMAEQQAPVRRKVALKVLKPGMDTRQVVVRFEAERQALALMDHPNIAHVLDGGTTDAGRPFFVMDLVKGISITKYCDQNQLTPHERLELFMQVCQGVQHAHQKGVIHRDLKPSNVLISWHDGTPVAKVIDFGVAKALGQQLTEKTLFTNFAEIIGTPLYMSPEQAGMSDLDVDTRSDIYSLGVLLYELLTGTTPFDAQRLKKAGFDEMRRIIREEEPAKPSTLISTVGQAATTASANRKSNPTQLSREFRGELDWIVMRCLEKDRNRRYETASGLARDIQHYLNDEVVEARPPSTGYRMKKFVRRHKGEVIATGLVLLTLLAGIAGTTWGLIAATRAAEAERSAKDDALDQKRLAEQAADRERKAKHEAEAKRQEAERNLAFAKKGNQILGSVFAGLDPRKIAESGRPLQDVLRQNLTQAVHEVEGSAIGDPLEVAAMQTTLGISLEGLGEATLAVEVLQKAFDTRKAQLGPNHPATLDTMNTLGWAYLLSDQLAKAVPLLEETLEKRKTMLGPEHPSTLLSMNNLAAAYQHSGQFAKARPLFEDALQKRRAQLGPDHFDTLVSMNNLAWAYHASVQVAKAIPLYEETLERRKALLGPDHPEMLLSMSDLAVAYHDSGQLAKAVRLGEETLEKRKAVLGPDHPDTLASMANLARSYVASSQLAKAVTLFEEALEKQKAKLGPDHRQTLLSMHNLAWAYRANGQLAKAMSLLEETLKRRKVALGPDHPETLFSMNNLAVVYRDNGQLAEALPLSEETLERRKAVLGPDHPDTLVSMNSLGWAYRTSGQLAKAVSLLEETLERRKAQFDPDHPDTLVTMNDLAVVYHHNGQLAEALPLYEETLERRKARLGPDHPDTLVSMNTLAWAYHASGQVAKAISLYEETLARRKARLGPDHPDTLLSMSDLAVAYHDNGQLAKAVTLSEETLEKRKVVLGPDHPDTLVSMANLARAYRANGQLAKAVRLCEEAVQGTENRGFRHLHARHIVLNTIATYEEAGQYDRADDWRQKWLAFVKEESGPESPAHAGELGAWGLALLRRQKWTEAEAVLRECLTVREKAEPDAWSTFSTQSLLGEALLGQQKYAEAEPLLLAGYEGTKAREATIPPTEGGELCIPAALDRLIELYTATNKPEEVKKWQTERAKYPETKPAGEK